MNHCPYTLIPRVAAVLAVVVAAVGFATTTSVTGDVTLASAFPIAQAQFAH